MFVYLMYKYQLLYVYINAYQSGGFMWYAVFDRSMLALVCGVFTLLCYLAIRQTYMSGPFYAILPLPPLIILFWRHCNSKFQVPAKVRISSMKPCCLYCLREDLIFSYRIYPWKELLKLIKLSKSALNTI